MSIFDAANEPSENFNDYVWLLYAEPGLGKTTWAVEAGALILDFEGGFSALNCDAVSFVSSKNPYRGIESPPSKVEEARDTWLLRSPWQRFTTFVDLIRGGLIDWQWPALAIDTVDVAYEFCLEQVCKDNGWNHPDDGGDYGKGWSVVNKEFQRIVKRLFDFSIADSPGIGFLSHAKVRTTKARGMVPVDKMTPSLSPSAAKWLIGACDFVLYGEAAVTESGTRVRIVHTQPCTRFEAKARGSRDFPMPSPLPLDFSVFQDAWTKCVKGEPTDEIHIRHDIADITVATGDTLPTQNPWT